MLFFMFLDKIRVPETKKKEKQKKKKKQEKNFAFEFIHISELEHSLLFCLWFDFYRPLMRKGNVFILSVCLSVFLSVSVSVKTFEFLD